jgi:hypothetical protein
MPVLLIAAGVVVLAVAVYDVLSTTLAMETAAGPVTRRVAKSWWRLSHRMASGPRSPWMIISGPAVLVLSVGVWLLLLWAGWALIFSADVDAVVSSTTREPAGGWARVYFAAFSAFTLGLGDYIPSSAPWQVATSLAVISGLVLTTMAITYLIPVVNAVTARRVQASQIASLGSSSQDIVVRAHRGGDFSFLDHQLLPLSTGLLEIAEAHLAYPVLHYFHSAERHVDLRVQVHALDEAVSILQYGVHPDHAPHPGVLDSVRHAVAELVRRVDPVDGGEDVPPPPDLEPLRRAGVPTVDDDLFARRIEEVAEHRRRLIAFTNESRWDVATDPTEPRTREGSGG